MSISSQEAQQIAIRGLQYLAGNEEQLNQFLQLSGCAPASLRENAGSPEFLAGILAYFLADEPTLLAFCASHSIDPQLMAPAHLRLTEQDEPAQGTFQL